MVSDMSGSDSDADPRSTPSGTASDTPHGSPLRIWPAVFLLLATWALRIIPGWIDDLPSPMILAQFMGPAACCALVLVWWIMFSRATGKERLLGLLGLVAIGGASAALVDKSLAGFGTIIHVIPWGVTAFAGALVCLGRMRSGRRTWVALLAALVAFGYWDAVRSDGVWGDFHSDLSWRWESTAEDRFLQKLAARSAPGEAVGLSLGDPLAEPEWPAFRGPRRDGIQPGIVLDADWTAHPPTEVWKIQVGPGWSSFSVAGNRIFTQEQRGDNEAVVCYSAADGAQLWTHAYPSRFWESVAGAGPRATPTLSGGMLFALGAEGLLFRLDPRTGEQVWRRDLRVDAGRDPPTPIWGFSSSPLVVGGAVVVHAGGADDKGVLAYDVQTGQPRWTAPAGDDSYSSPQLAQVAGHASILMLTNQGLAFIDPADGRILGEHTWEFEGYRVVQPLLLGTSSVLLGTGMGTGTRRIDVRAEAGAIVSTERWTSRHMKPDYNDYVAHQGFLYGFDHNMFACVDLETGARQWKRGRYGNGQVLLLPEAGQLLVTTESGELVLLQANPQRLEELARCKVLDGKTWNHPVLVGDVLFVRNGQQAACYKMKIAASPVGTEARLDHGGLGETTIRSF